MNTKDSVREKLFGKTLDELKAVAAELEMPGYAAGQVADWLYGKRVSSADEMTNLSLASRQKLASRFEMGLTPYSRVTESADGTKKYLFPVHQGNHVEAVYIPEKKRDTLCLSTQAGCRMGCRFCMTGKQGHLGDLTAGEILNQLRMIDEAGRITNIVYMGMGEPFDNTAEVMKSLEILTAGYGFKFSPRRITVSTIGIIPGMRQFLEKSNCHLAVSLHSPFDEERADLIPAGKKYPLHEIISELKSFETGRQRRISFEYIVFGGLNDTPRHARELARIFNGLRCRMNLIRFHSFPGTNLEPAEESAMISFKSQLERKGITTTIRQSRGEDIFAACGMLSTREQHKTG